MWNMNRVWGTLALSLLFGLAVTSRSLEAQTEAQTLGQTPPAGGDASVAAPPGIEDTTWRLVAYRSGDALAELVESARPARFRFEEGQVSGSGGCNRLMGTYELNGDAIAIDPRMAATMMACPDPIMTQEQSVGTAIGKVGRFRIEGELLELQDADGQPLLRFLWQMPSPLMDQVWQLTRYNNGKQAVVTVLADTEITIELRDDGTIGGSDGCNRYMSGYTLEGERLTIGPLVTTRMACPRPDGAQQQATDYAAALTRVAGYRIEGDDLTLVDGEGKTTAEYRLQVSLPPPPAESAETAPAER